ncbi:hypothetical protein C8J56DRAFT_977798 [Mycena floridula]|nr:hypothetical protein C8J56DRAFT_977798 [Mycena floridula]
MTDHGVPPRYKRDSSLNSIASSLNSAASTTRRSLAPSSGVANLHVEQRDDTIYRMEQHIMVLEQKVALERALLKKSEKMEEELRKDKEYLQRDLRRSEEEKRVAEKEQLRLTNMCHDLDVARLTEAAESGILRRDLKESQDRLTELKDKLHTERQLDELRSKRPSIPAETCQIQAEYLDHIARLELERDKAEQTVRDKQATLDEACIQKCNDYCAGNSYTRARFAGHSGRQSGSAEVDRLSELLKDSQDAVAVKDTAIAAQQTRIIALENAAALVVKKAKIYSEMWEDLFGETEAKDRRIAAQEIRILELVAQVSRTDQRMWMPTLWMPTLPSMYPVLQSHQRNTQSQHVHKRKASDAFTDDSRLLFRRIGKTPQTNASIQVAAKRSRSGKT